MRRRKEGKANRDLIIALALAALIAFLMQVQTGAIDVSSLLSKGGKAASPGAASESGLIVLPETPVDAFAAAGRSYIAQRSQDLESRRLADWRWRSGVAWMDGDSGARMLEQLTPAVAAAILSSLPPRSAARILNDANPTISAKWLDLLANPQALPPVPDELKALAAQAGLYDNTDDLLTTIRAELAAAKGAGSAASPLSGSPADAAGGNPANPAAATPPTGAGAAGAATPAGTPPATPPGTTPASPPVTPPAATPGGAGGP